MKLDLRNGPWKIVFKGSFQDHDVEISSNPDQAMLVSIFEKEGEEIVGIVLQVFSIFSAVGEPETFIESLQREAILLSRHDGRRTVQFIGLASKPVYSKAKGEDIAKAVDNLLEEVKASSKKASDVAKSFGLKLTPLGKCSSAMKQAFFSQPAIIPMMVREKRAIELEKEEAVLQAGTEGTAVVLGLTRDGKPVKEPLQMFQRSIVADGTTIQRAQIIQIIVESYLLANIPAIIFDPGQSFSGLGHPSKKISELQRHGLNIEPIGFPTKGFEPAKDIKVNLNAVSPSGLLHLFGCKDKEAEKILAQVLRSEKVQSTSQLIASIGRLGSETSENMFLNKRVQRIISLVDALYPELFAGPNDLKEIAKSWFQKIGRASIVNVSRLDPRALTFLLASLSKELVTLFGSQPQSGKPRLLIAIPGIDRGFVIRNNPVLRDLVRTLAEMKRFGIGFVIGTEKKSDLGRELLQIAETNIGIIKENDAAIDLPNAKNYRVLLRPTLSQSQEES